jgi:hypothetical protein
MPFFKAQQHFRPPDKGVLPLFEDILYLVLFVLLIVVSTVQLIEMLAAKKAFGYEYVFFIALGIFSIAGFIAIGKAFLSGLMEKSTVD